MVCEVIYNTVLLSKDAMKVIACVFWKN